MNRNEYDADYPGLYRAGRVPGHRNGGASVAPSSRNDYDVESMLSARSLPQRDYLPPRWDGGAGGRARVTPDYDRRSELAARGCSPAYATMHSPPRVRTPYRGDDNVDFGKLEPLPRREYSPMRNADRSAEGAFKGFTTSLPEPGNEAGYFNGRVEDEARARRYATGGASAAAIGEPPDRFCSTVAAPYARGYASSLPPVNDSYAAGNLLQSQQHPPPTSRYGYSGEKNRIPYDGSYSRAPISHYRGETKSTYEAAPSVRYTRDSAVGATASKYRNPDCYRSWDSASCWDSGPEQSVPTFGEQALSPRTFKRECQRAYKEARAQRMRNLEEGLYGKCDWATFDSKYC